MICKWVTKLSLFVPNHNIIGLMTAKMDREMRVTEIARAYPPRPQGEDILPIKRMAPLSSSVVFPSVLFSSVSGDSGVGERANAQEESDALRDLSKIRWIP